MIKILTVEREYGSGAAEIAQRLADPLGWKLWNQLLTNEIARQMDCDSKQHRRAAGAPRPARLSPDEILHAGEF